MESLESVNELLYPLHMPQRNLQVGKTITMRREANSECDATVVCVAMTAERPTKVTVSLMNRRLLCGVWPRTSRRITTFHFDKVAKGRNCFTCSSREATLDLNLLMTTCWRSPEKQVKVTMTRRRGRKRVAFVSLETLLGRFMTEGKLQHPPEFLLQVRGKHVFLEQGLRLPKMQVNQGVNKDRESMRWEGWMGRNDEYGKEKEQEDEKGEEEKDGEVDEDAGKDGEEREGVIVPDEDGKQGTDAGEIQKTEEKTEAESAEETKTESEDQSEESKNENKKEDGEVEERDGKCETENHKNTKEVEAGEKKNNETPVVKKKTIKKKKNKKMKKVWTGKVCVPREKIVSVGEWRPLEPQKVETEEIKEETREGVFKRIWRRLRAIWKVVYTILLVVQGVFIIAMPLLKGWEDFDWDSSVSWYDMGSWSE